MNSVSTALRIWTAAIAASALACANGMAAQAIVPTSVDTPRNPSLPLDRPPPPDIGFPAKNSSLHLLFAAAANGTGSDGGNGNGNGNGGNAGNAGNGGNGGGWARPPTGPRPRDNFSDAEAEAGAALEALSRIANARIGRCAALPGHAAQLCIAQILDEYGAGLAKLKNRLPSKTRNLPQIVATAAREVRDAPTSLKSVGALQKAIENIRKDIPLIRADDADAGIATRDVNAVGGTLNHALFVLKRAEDL